MLFILQLIFIRNLLISVTEMAELSSQTELLHQDSLNKVCSSISIKLYWAEPLHQCQPGPIGQSSTPMPSRASTSTPTRLYQVELPLQPQSSLIGQSFYLNCNRASSDIAPQQHQVHQLYALSESLPKLLPVLSHQLISISVSSAHQLISEEIFA